MKSAPSYHLAWYYANRERVLAQRQARRKPRPVAVEISGERWLPVVGWESVYEVSDHARVRRLAPARGSYAGRLLIPQINKHGYLAVHLVRAGKELTRPVHRLVAEAFLDGWRDGKQVNHIDGVKTNAMLNNLEWVTAGENMAHAHRTGLNPGPRRKSVR